MARWIASVMLLTVVSLVAFADDEKQTEAGKAFNRLRETLLDELKASGRDGAKRREVLEKHSAKFLEHAKKNKTDDSAVEALVMAVGMNRPASETKVRGQAIDLLKTDFIKSKLIGPMLKQVLGEGIDQNVLDIAKAVFKDNPDKLTRALAARALRDALYERVKLAKMAEDDADLKEQLDTFAGTGTAKKLIAGIADAKAEAEEYSKALRGDFKGLIPDYGIGALAPETKCVDIKGKEVKLSDYKGKVVVLDFWATWCGPCRAMIPHSHELVKENAKKPFAFISISVDEKRETLENFLEKVQMPWTHWWDGASKVAGQWEVNGFPTVYIIDHEGVIRHKQSGFDEDDKTMNKLISELVKKAEAEAGKK